MYESHQSVDNVIAQCQENGVWDSGNSGEALGNCMNLRSSPAVTVGFCCECEILTSLLAQGTTLSVERGIDRDRSMLKSAWFKIERSWVHVIIMLDSQCGNELIT